ncbi:hypothetical protein [Bacillus phage DZ1]|uniref:Uncharacterized protein n=1 Tax=Bacillus phage DZ1 TaxID=3075862 RepID=A0AA96EJP5_9CAUD|nr:hypothetical protein [Bacillus phage DZ1]
MKVKTLEENVGLSGRPAGEVIEVDEETAAHWLSIGAAEEVKAPAKKAPAKKAAAKE